MIELAIMIEGQNGLNWKHWQRISQIVEEAGFAGLYRSDHFTNANPPDVESLELWVSLTWLASHTRRIEFGPLVSPVSFRHPAFTARIAAAVDDLSGGRLTLGVGAGWQEREHAAFGFDLLPLPERFARFTEGLQVIQGLLRSDTPVDFDGRYYSLRGAVLLPRPARPGGPPILIGGNGEHRTLPLAAQYADEWNGVYLIPQDFARLNRRLDELLDAARRPPAAVRRSLMTGCVYGADHEAVERKVALRTKGKRSSEQLRAHGVVVGTSSEVRDQLFELEQVGVQRVMLQWLDLEDVSGLEHMAQALLDHRSE